MLKEGDTIPGQIELFDQDDVLRKLGDFQGKRTVYYTYPTDLIDMSLLMSLLIGDLRSPFFV